VSRGEVLMFGESHTHVDNATSFPQRVISLEFLMAICGKNFAMSNELVGSCATVLSGEVLTGTKREGVGCVLSCRYCIAKTKPHGEIPYLDFPVSAAAEEFQNWVRLLSIQFEIVRLSWWCASRRYTWTPTIPQQNLGFFCVTLKIMRRYAFTHATD
jgi:hypothetical protein